MKKINIYLIRHAKTEANNKKMIYGYTDFHISEADDPAVIEGSAEEMN